MNVGHGGSVNWVQYLQTVQPMPHEATCFKCMAIRSIFQPGVHVHMLFDTFIFVT